MKMEKMSFKGIKDVLSRDEMKSIMAGSSNGGGGGGGSYWTNGYSTVPFSTAGSNSVYVGNGVVVTVTNSQEGSTQPTGGGSWTSYGGSSGTPDNPAPQPQSSPYTLICTSGNYPVSTCANPYCPTGSYVYCG